MVMVIFLHWRYPTISTRGSKMSLTKYQEPPLFEQHGAAERRFLQLISALPKVSVQGYDKHRNVIYWNKSNEI